MEQACCSVCGASEATQIYDLPDYLLQRPNVSARLVRCCTCGLVYQNPRPTLAEMAEHYPPEYESYAPVPSGGSWLFRQAIQYGTAKRTRFVTAYMPAGRLLDVGCASGIFLRGMQARAGWEVCGVEINAEVARLARERYQLNVFAGTLEQAEFPEASFDTVTMWDVLEHLHDPAASLREVHRILKPDGILVARVPNLDSRDAQLFGRYWAGLDAPRHLCVFTPKTLSTLLVANGLAPHAWSCGIGAYTTFLLSLRFWAAAQARPNRFRDGLIRFLYHPLMRLLSAPIFQLRSMGLRGPSLVVVALRQSQFTR
jgi:SAM-dependent methyltransferase